VSFVCEVGELNGANGRRVDGIFGAADPLVAPPLALPAVFVFAVAGSAGQVDRGDFPALYFAAAGAVSADAPAVGDADSEFFRSISLADDAPVKA
jgi:hypothetical protein